MIHSDATRLLAWEKLTLVSLGDDAWASQTIDGYFLTAESWPTGCRLACGGPDAAGREREPPDDTP